MKISIITVSYNSAETIATTLRSVAVQNYRNLEHLIIDGQSSDETIKLAETHSHPNLKIISEPDGGIYDAMNKGVQLATGQIIGILNSDDFYIHSNVLNQVSEAFAADNTLDVILGDVDFVDRSNLKKPVRRYSALGFKIWMFRFGVMPPHPAIFIRKSAYNRVGFYNTTYQIAADFDFLLRLLLIDEATYYATGKHWVRMRNGGASTSSWRSTLIITKEMYRSLNEHNVHSNILLLLLRLPFKFFKQIIFNLN